MTALEATAIIDSLMLLAKWEITKGFRPNSHGRAGDSRGGSLKVKNNELVEWRAELKFNGLTIPELLSAVQWYKEESNGARFVDYADTKKALSDLGLRGATKFFRDLLIDFAEDDRFEWNPERQALATRISDWAAAT